MKQCLHEQLGISTSIDKLLYEWYLKEFDDYAELDNLEDLPSSMLILFVSYTVGVKIRISNRDYSRTKDKSDDMLEVEYADDDNDVVVLDAEDKRGRYVETRLVRILLKNTNILDRKRNQWNSLFGKRFTNKSKSSIEKDHL
jgi:hypothetical protein